MSSLAHDLMRLDARFLSLRLDQVNASLTLSAEDFSPTLPPAMCSYLGAASL